MSAKDLLVEERPIHVSRCGNKYHVRFSAFLRACGRSYYYPQINIDTGEPYGHVFAVHPYYEEPICPPCAANSERLWQNIMDRWPYFSLALEPYDPEGDKSEQRKSMDRARMRHALSPTPPPRVNGLRRQDGSGDCYG